MRDVGALPTCLLLALLLGCTRAQGLMVTESVYAASTCDGTPVASHSTPTGECTAASAAFKSSWGVTDRTHCGYIEVSNKLYWGIV